MAHETTVKPVPGGRNLEMRDYRARCAECGVLGTHWSVQAMRRLARGHRQEAEARENLS